MGEVTKFNPYGALVKINPEFQGLCHISEFGLRTEMEEKLKIGKKYKFQILEIRPKEYRLSLKLAEKQGYAHFSFTFFVNGNSAISAYPYTLNNAVDRLLKEKFDKQQKKKIEIIHIIKKGKNK